MSEETQGRQIRTLPQPSGGEDMSEEVTQVSEISTPTYSDQNLRKQRREPPTSRGQRWLHRGSHTGVDLSERNKSPRGKRKSKYAARPRAGGGD